MAERPLGFARRMMAQQLMTDALGNEFSDSPFFAGKVRPSTADIERPTTAADMYPYCRHWFVVSARGRCS